MKYIPPAAVGVRLVSPHENLTDQHPELDTLWRAGGDEAVLRFIEAGGVGDRWTVLSTPTGYVVKKPDEPSKVAGGRWVERQRDDWPSSR